MSVPMKKAYATQGRPARVLGSQLGAMRVFLTVWLGQLISIIGSGMSGFALGIHVLQETGSATQFALISLSSVLPRAILSPVAGGPGGPPGRGQPTFFFFLASGVGTPLFVVMGGPRRVPGGGFLPPS